MFRKTLAFSFLFLLLVSSIAYWNHLHLRSDDSHTYVQLTDEYKHKKASRALECCPATQLRQQIQKDLWIPEKNIHVRIEADHSEMRLSERHRKIEAIETLHQLVCRSDDRHLTAEAGTYFYPSLEMECQEFCYHDKEIRLKAQRGHLVYPDALHCEGEVQLMLANNCALSDEMLYTPSTQMLVLSGKHRVLFCNEGLRLSAPEIRMRCNDNFTCDEVQGIGDVHCTLDLQEEELIETLFSKYL